VFFILEANFFLAIIRPEESKAKQPPTPPNGIVAGKPTTDKDEPKLALENAAERTLESPALQLTTFFAPLYFLATNRQWVTSLFRAVEISLILCNRKLSGS